VEFAELRWRMEVELEVEEEVEQEELVEEWLELQYWFEKWKGRQWEILSQQLEMEKAHAKVDV